MAKPACSMLKCGKLLNWRSNSWYVESMDEYLSHDEQTVAGGGAEAVVMLLVNDEL